MSALMKIYENVDVNAMFQNCGSVWLVVLEGSHDNIELVFNGLWNLGAINVSVERSDGSIYNGLEYTDHTKTKAYFWSSPKRMYSFFFNWHLLKCQQESCAKYAHVVAAQRIEEFKRDTINFFNYDRVCSVNTFQVGTISAERPDDNYRDSALTHSLRKSGEKTVDKE